MLSADNLAGDSIPSVRSLIQIKNRRGPKTDSYWTPANMCNQSEFGHRLILFGICYLRNFEAI